MWMECFGPEGLPAGFRVEDIIFVACDYNNRLDDKCYRLRVSLADGHEITLMNTDDKMKMINLYYWIRERVKQDKVSTITEDGTIIVSNKGAHWDD